MPIPLNERILTVIRRRPGIAAADLRAALPDVSETAVRYRVGVLMAAGRIERVSYGRYRLPVKPMVTKPVSPVVAPIATVPLSRLMAGR
jgi:hypothetical protein